MSEMLLAENEILKKENKEFQEKSEILSMHNNLLKENLIAYKRFYEDISDFLWCGVCGTVTDIQINDNFSKNADKKINTSPSYNKHHKSEKHCGGIFNSLSKNIINDNESEELSINNSKNPLEFISKNCMKYCFKNREKSEKTIPFFKNCNEEKNKGIKYFNSECVEIGGSTDVKNVVCQRCPCAQVGQFNLNENNGQHNRKKYTQKLIELSDMRQQSIKKKDDDTYSKTSVNNICNNSMRSISTNKLDCTPKKDCNKTLKGIGNKTERDLKQNRSSKKEFLGGNIKTEVTANLEKYDDSYCRNSRFNSGDLHLDKKNRLKAKSVGKNLHH